MRKTFYHLNRLHVILRNLNNNKQLKSISKRIIPQTVSYNKGRGEISRDIKGPKYFRGEQQQVSRVSQKAYSHYPLNTTYTTAIYFCLCETRKQHPTRTTCCSLSLSLYILMPTCGDNRVASGLRERERERFITLK